MAKHNINQSTRQPLAVAQIREALLKMETVQAITSLSRSCIYSKMAAKDGKPFPQPVRMGARCARWQAGAVTDWLAAQAA
jgi:prophage regulatory protein